MEFFIKLIMVVTGISGTFNFNGLEVPVVTRGDGLYLDNDIYLYRGKNLNNYILFSDELWRIISFSDGGVRIIRNESIGNMSFDSSNSNEWYSSSLRDYLNSDYYVTLASKNIINSDIELISMEEFLNSSSDRKRCISLKSYFSNFDRCFKSTYISFIKINNSDHVMWTKSADDDGSKGVFYVGNIYFGDGMASDSEFGVVPVINLNKSIKLSGSGTLQNPYKIEK